MDIAEAAMPLQWQHTMRLQGFDPIEHDDKEFIEFCERCEFMDPGGPSPTQTRPSNTPPTGILRNGPTHSLPSNRNQFKLQNDSSKCKFLSYASYDPMQFCNFHRVQGHATENCIKAKNEAK